MSAPARAPLPRPRPTETERALGVHCPACKALPGENCFVVDRFRRYLLVHHARREKANELRVVLCEGGDA